jgi:NAD(P)-dependent dehydrogenase (short-subunit alcohol dehydrogenase family)
VKIQAGKVAVITGAGSGIGAALAHACAGRGMHIVAADIELDAAERTVNELRSRGSQAVAVEVNVARRDAVQHLAERTREAFGACHLLCNNAGVSVNRPVAECTAADWEWVWSVNVAGITHAIEAFMPMLREQTEASHIVNTASMAGLIPLPGFGAYVASKYAVVGLSEVLHQELADTLTGVSILCPGVVDTQIFASERNRFDGGDTSTQPPAASADTDDGSAMQTDFEETYTRMLSPQEVAEITLAAVEDEQLYVATHPEWLALFKQRSGAIDSAFGGSVAH